MRKRALAGGQQQLLKCAVVGRGIAGADRQAQETPESLCDGAGQAVGGKGVARITGMESGMRDFLRLSNVYTPGYRASIAKDIGIRYPA